MQDFGFTDEEEAHQLHKFQLGDHSYVKCSQTLRD